MLVLHKLKNALQYSTAQGQGQSFILDIQAPTTKQKIVQSYHNFKQQLHTVLHFETCFILLAGMVFRVVCQTP